ncbi:hypothetical protein E4U36_004577 [Claviceps purpurea]|nr:hypothetical protein E4U36_004577 [Claviceps purpurea]
MDMNAINIANKRQGEQTVNSKAALSRPNCITPGTRKLRINRPRSQEPGARSQEPGARSQEPGDRIQENQIKLPGFSRALSSSRRTDTSPLRISQVNLVCQHRASVLSANAYVDTHHMLLDGDAPGVKSEEHEDAANVFLLR